MALSKTQTKRLGGILTIMFGDDIPSDLITDGYIVVNGQSYELTDKGKDEKNRLCTLAGLNIMYSSEKKETLK